MKSRTRTVARPLATLTRRAGKRPPVQALLDLCAEHEVTQIVVGLPLTLAGDDSDWTREVRAFAERLHVRSGIPVELVDERLSSVVAERAVRSSGLRKTQREQKQRIDAGAAAVILQAFLDTRRAEPSDP